MDKGRKEIRPEKIKIVEDLAKLMNSYKIVGIMNLHKTPASVLQEMKSILNGKAVIKVSKKVLINFALEKAGKQNLKEFVQSYPALILTNDDPFML
jgi:large subunit ribosomal protein L10